MEILGLIAVFTGITALLYFIGFIFTIALLEPDCMYFTEEQRQKNLEIALSWPIYIVILPLKLAKIVWKVTKRELKEIFEKS